MFTDWQKIGLGLTGFGIFFIFLGILLFLDRSLLAMGNILFISGVALLIGLQNAFRFFFQVQKVKASAFFFSGVAIVLLGYPLIGIILEGVGFFLLFHGFFPAVINLLRRLPIVSAIFLIPGVNTVADRICGGLPV